MQYSASLRASAVGFDGELCLGDAVEPSGRFGFFLFVLLNLVLFIRPGEILPALIDVPFFEILIILCALFSLWPLAALFDWQSLALQPVVLCVVGLIPIVLFSNLVHGSIYDA